MIWESPDSSRSLSSWPITNSVETSFMMQRDTRTTGSMNNTIIADKLNRKLYYSYGLFGDDMLSPGYHFHTQSNHPDFVGWSSESTGEEDTAWFQWDWHHHTTVLLELSPILLHGRPSINPIKIGLWCPRRWPCITFCDGLSLLLLKDLHNILNVHPFATRMKSMNLPVESDIAEGQTVLN